MNEPEKKTILLVEDQVIVAMREAKTITNFGYEVITAHTGEKAVEIALNNKNINLVLMDIDLGKGVDGPQTALQILEKRNIPIVFLTSHPEQEYVDKVKKITRYGYVIKNSGDFVLQSSIEMAFELFAENKQLNVELLGRKQTEDKLNERIKELQAFYSLSELCEKKGISLDKLYQEIVNMLPKSWQYPEIACSRIVIGNNDYRTENFRESNWKQSAPIKVNGAVVGELEIGYLEERPEADEGTFLKEEKLLLDAIVERIGRVSERKQTEEDLNKNEERLVLALRGADLGIWDWDVKTSHVIFSDRWVEMIGYKHGELKPDVSTWESLLHPDDKDKVFKSLNKHFEDEKQEYRVDFRLKCKSGDWKWIHARGMVVERDESKKPIRMTGTHLDINDRKNAEEKINNLLQQKELMLKEVHHRTKNNINIIMSLLSLQANVLKEPAAIEALNDARSRIQGIILLYEKLYHTDDFKETSIKGYLSDLVDDIIDLFESRGRLKVEVNIVEISVDVNLIIPLGIIVNEIVTNSIKYAFKGIPNPKISISATVDTERQMTLIMQDNGIGFDKPECINNLETFGLRLINLLVKQLDGNIKQENNEGTKYILQLKI